MRTNANGKEFPSQIVFVESDQCNLTQDGVECVRKYMSGVGCKLPSGMYAFYVRRIYPDGTVEVEGRKQARSKFARRDFYYKGRDAETQAQTELLKWSDRILRERAKEGR